MHKFAAASIVSLCASMAQADTTYPLTLPNCGQQITCEQDPKGAVSIGQATTEMLYALGMTEEDVLGKSSISDRALRMSSTVSSANMAT